ALASILLDLPYELHPIYQRGAVYRFFTPPSGVFLGADGIHKARALEGILDFGFTMQAGTKVEPYADGAARPGYCVATGNTRDEAIEIAEKAISMMTYTMESLS